MIDRTRLSAFLDGQRFSNFILGVIVLNAITLGFCLLYTSPSPRD